MNKARRGERERRREGGRGRRTYLLDVPVAGGVEELKGAGE